MVKNRRIVISSEIVSVKLKYTTIIFTTKVHNWNRKLQVASARSTNFQFDKHFIGKCKKYIYIKQVQIQINADTNLN